MPSRARASVAIYNPEPRDIRWHEDDDAIYFNVHGDVWFVLNNKRKFAATNLADEAAAMRKLAETAAEVARKLEQRYTADCSPFHNAYGPGCPYCTTEVR